MHNKLYTAAEQISITETSEPHSRIVLQKKNKSQYLKH